MTQWLHLQGIYTFIWPFMASAEQKLIRVNFSHVQWNVAGALKKWRAGVEVSWILTSDHEVICVCGVNYQHIHRS